MRIPGLRDRIASIQVGIALAAIWIGATLSASAQTDWAEANKLAGAIGGWRSYARERAAAPLGYPTVPGESEAMLPAEVLAASPSLDSEVQLARWESRRYAERSAPLAPPTLSYARTSGEADSSFEVGVHLPVGTWIERSRSLAADQNSWGIVERRILELQAARNRLVTYADAVAAKAELAQAMDRVEVQSVLEELTRRQREIASVPEFELLSLQIERIDAQEAEANARETAIRAAERLAIGTGKPLSDAAELQGRLPLELSVPDKLPQLDESGRLDVSMAEESLTQQQSALSRSRSGLWLGGLEVGVLQERFDTGEVNNTVELRWRLPFGGEASRQVNLGDRLVRERQLQLGTVHQNAEREIAEATRAKSLGSQRLLQSAEALKSAEAWMDEQVYRYSGMLIGPQDLLRAAVRLRLVRSRHIAAQRAAFVAEVDFHFARAIPTRALMPTQPTTSALSTGAMH